VTGALGYSWNVQHVEGSGRVWLLFCQTADRPGSGRMHQVLDPSSPGWRRPCRLESLCHSLTWFSRPVKLPLAVVSICSDIDQ
jgi:hypothetical protein